MDGNVNKFNKLYEDIFKPASAEEVVERKKLADMERFKDWCNENNVKYNVDDKDNIISFNKNTIDNKDDYGTTALMFASLNNNIEIAKLVLDNDADFASLNNNIEIAKLVLDNGADIDARDVYGSTALRYANNDKTRDILKQYGARI